MSNRAVVLALMSWVALGCGRAPIYEEAVGWDGIVVGGACIDDYDCDIDSYCERGRALPRGTCTVPCRYYEDCPHGTACVDHRGGICLLECYDTRDCRPGYTCALVRERRGPLWSDVCIR